jgi:hypothetical protein
MVRVFSSGDENMHNDGFRLIFNRNLAAGGSGFEDGVADHGIFIAIQEIGAVGGDALVIDDGIQQVGDLMDESVFPSDHMTLRPPIFPERMEGLGNQDVMETLGFFGLVVLPKDLDFVEALEVVDN